MNNIIAWAVSKGYGKDFLANVLRKVLTGGSTLLCTYLAQRGVAPDTLDGFSAWAASLVPIVVAVIWEILEKRFAAKVTAVALEAPSGTTLAVVKAEAVTRMKDGVS